jgi:hypothetical protein
MQLVVLLSRMGPWPSLPARLAAELIKSIVPNEHGWFFPSATDPTRPVSHGTLYAFMWRQREREVIPVVTNRDLRRTWKTLAGKAGLPKEIRDRIQNHALQDVSSKNYDRWTYNRRGVERARCYHAPMASLHDLCDVPVDRCRRNQIAMAEGRFDFLGFQIAATAVFLNGANRPRVAGRGVAIGGLLDRQEKAVFVGGRVRPRPYLNNTHGN